MDSSPIQIPDAINCSELKNFTQVPNDLLRNPEISGKAKALLCLLLSNKEGWHSYITSIKNMMKEKESAILSAINELEQHHYLRRVRYRDKQSKTWKGSFWAYTDTPNVFNMEEQAAILNKYGYELVVYQMENPHRENPHVGNPHVGNQGLIILNNNNTNNNNTKLNYIPPTSQVGGECIKSNNKKPSRKELSKQYIPLARYLYDIVRTNRNIEFKPAQIESWAYNICQLIEINGIEPRRIRAALRWYKNHIGEPYVPVIASGQSLRDKFLNLESAMVRENNPPPKNINLPICPNGWKFGSCDEERVGCINCEQDSYKLFLQCKAHRKHLSNT